MGIRGMPYKCLRRVCAALRRTSHLETEPSLISIALATFEKDYARRSGESHILKITRPQSVSRKLLKRMCAAVRREPHSENGAPAIRESLVTVSSECAPRKGDSLIV
eukprot:6622982-Pyramimonas_sp.AAC.1